MTTIITIFIVALMLSLALTPLAGRLGTRFGAMDKPGERKVHARPIPRSGGPAIFASFFLALALGTLCMTDVSNKLVLDRQTMFILLGALVVFGVGLFDDFHRLGPRIKFIFQIIGASIAFWGGLRIEVFSFFGLNLHFNTLGYFVTVFWFVLFINAVNLIDGLDGLAAGIVFFTSAVLVILSVLRGQYLIAMLFAALAGASLGFLRYNFNPASIFMGDGGSYFLGYMLAALSIMGSIKSQVGAAMLIPMVALGVPLFDTVFSPIRRFILGKEMFMPDRGHIHHKLVSMGFSTKRAVWIIYGISVCLCAIAIFMVNLRNETAGLFLIVLGAGAIIFVRKLGYFEYITSDKIYGWFKDVTDEAGFTRDRRSFLNLQIEIGKSKGLQELWENTCRALDMLKFDTAEMDVEKSVVGGRWSVVREEADLRHSELQGSQRAQGEKDLEDKDSSGISRDSRLRQLVWSRDGFDRSNDISKDCLLKLELPLLDNANSSLGTLWLIKDLRRDSVSHYTLRRVEHLRRSVVGSLEKLKNQSPPPNVKEPPSKQ